MIEHLRKTSTTYECFLRDGQRLLASQPDRNEAITLLIETFKFPTVGAVESGHRRKTKKSLKNLRETLSYRPVKGCNEKDNSHFSSPCPPKNMSNSKEQEHGAIFSWHDAWYLTYGIVMFLILTIGFLGNALTVLILRKPEHVSKALTPLMINLSIGSLIIIVLGYPVVITLLLTGGQVGEDDPTCRWNAFVNGTVGISGIITLTEMSLVINYSLHKANPNVRLSNKKIGWLIAGSWFYGLLSMCPPLIGWSRFVPGAARISCGPDWTDKSTSGMTYSLALVVVGFFLPLSLMCRAYYRIYRLLRRELFTPENRDFRLRQKLYMAKVVRMTVTAIIVFMVSWSPYCFVSIAAVFKGSHVFNSGEAEIPELMAKASVIYNPIVYVAMNDRFRRSLTRLISCKIHSSVEPVRRNMSPRTYCENIEYKNGDDRVTKRRRHVAFVVKPLKKRDSFSGMYVVDIAEVS